MTSIFLLVWTNSLLLTILHGKTRKTWEYSLRKQELMSGEAWREWLQVTQGGCERGGAQLPEQCTGSSIRALYRSLGLHTLAWLKLPVLDLTGRKLTFKFSTYVFECRSLPPYVHLVSTPVYYSEHKQKVKMGEALEQGYSYPLLFIITSVNVEHLGANLSEWIALKCLTLGV